MKKPVSGARDKSRGQTPDLRRWLGCPPCIMKETQYVLAEPVPGTKAEPDESKSILFMWSLLGPGFPSGGGTFKLELSAPKEYFMTNICHPKVAELGRICLDIVA